jgi:hypothetical protein
MTNTEKRVKEASLGYNPMSLRTFSLRFGIKQNLLSWGIVRKKYINSDGIEKIDEQCAVLIKGFPVYIEIADNKMKKAVSGYTYKYERCPCKMRRLKKYYSFESENVNLLLDRDNVEEFFAPLIFSLSTRIFLGGSYWDE